MGRVGEETRFPPSPFDLFLVQGEALQLPGFFVVDEVVEAVDPLYQLRLQLFRRALNRLDVIKSWKYGTVLYEAIGQHYGLRTRLLDIMSSFLTALFFATTYYSEGKYRPITREFIAKHPEYSRGSLYFYIGRNPSSLEIHRLESQEPNPVLPIGYQPFMRCAGQYGYMLFGDREYNLVEDNRFARYTFVQEDGLSLDIFNKCRGGASVFPLDGSDLIAMIAFRVNGLRRFSLATLHESGIDEDDARLLEKDGVSFCEEDDLGLVAKEEEINEFNRQYREFDFERYYGIKLRTRRIIR